MPAEADAELPANDAGRGLGRGLARGTSPARQPGAEQAPVTDRPVEPVQLVELLETRAHERLQ